MQNNKDKHENISGVFSSQEVKKVGTGTTTRKTIQKTLWFCTEQPDGQIEVQPLNTNYVPSGPKRRLSLEQFLSMFSPEPEVYMTSVFPKMRELNKTIARADRHRANGESFSAEMEYGNALKVDEENVRANFGLGLTYLTRGENDKADNIFGRLVKLEAVFEEEHKHLFNEFGINLRKSGMLDQAASYYGRALELSQNDANLFYNMARVYLEKKDIPQAVNHLVRSLDLNPRLEPAIKFLTWLITKGVLPEDKKAAVAGVLQKIKAAAAEPVLSAGPESSGAETAEGASPPAGAPPAPKADR